MKRFEARYFQRFRYTADQIGAYLDSATRDLAVARNSPIPEVIFRFTYDALVKLAIYVVSHHGFKVRSIPGHHVKLLEKLGDELDDEEVALIADEMRRKRNLDLYQAAAVVTSKDAQNYFEFVETVFGRVREKLSP